MNTVALTQGSPEWHSWRAAGIGASEAPVILGVSPWTTPYQLWALKTGRANSPQVNAAMRRGTDLEPAARAAFERQHRTTMQPVCLAHDEHTWMRASLDGIAFAGDPILEIKCPGREDHRRALDGEVPEKYRPQLQHALHVAGATRCLYWSYDGAEGALVEVALDPGAVAELLAAELDFWGLWQRDEAPALGPRDCIERDDADWLTAAAAWARSDRALKQAQADERAAREALVERAGAHTTRGGGARVAYIERKGAVDYARVPALAGVDVEPYRKAPSRYFQVKHEDE